MSRTEPANPHQDSDDKEIPEDGSIEAAHPLHTNEHLIYAEALRMVSAKYSKGALVELVNWLLYRLAWRKQHDWPKDATTFLVKVKTRKGWPPYDYLVAHFAQGGGEDQPRFGPGIFHYDGHLNREIPIEDVIGWKPFEQ